MRQPARGIIPHPNLVRRSVPAADYDRYLPPSCSTRGSCTVCTGSSYSARPSFSAQRYAGYRAFRNRYFR